jgi:hypothetical protein
MTARALILSGGLALAPVLSAATVLEPMGLNDLSQRAGTIAYGRVTEARPQWVQNGRQIDTFVTMDVEAYFKGDLGRRLTFRAPGGQIGVDRSLVPGAPSFGEGDELVLFLDDQQRQWPYVVGLSQGALPVQTDAQGRKWVLAPALSAGEAVGRAGLPVRTPIPLADLGRQVLALVRAARGGR